MKQKIGIWGAHACFQKKVPRKLCMHVFVRKIFAETALLFQLQAIQYASAAAAFVALLFVVVQSTMMSSQTSHDFVL